MTRRGLFALVTGALVARKLPAATNRLSQAEKLNLAHSYTRYQIEIQRRYNHLLSAQIETMTKGDLLRAARRIGKTTAAADLEFARGDRW